MLLQNSALPGVRAKGITSRMFDTPVTNMTTVMEVIDSTFGCLGDSTTTAEGWRMLFEDGFKAWIERKRQG